MKVVSGMSAGREATIKFSALILTTLKSTFTCDTLTPDATKLVGYNLDVTLLLIDESLILSGCTKVAIFQSMVEECSITWSNFEH